MHKHVRDANLDDVVFQPGETPTQFADRMLNHVLDSGHAMILLGGLLAPAELPEDAWSPTIADEMTTFLQKCTAPSDKQTIFGLLAQALIGFFQNGLASLMTSRTSSPATGVLDEPSLRAGM